MGGLRQTALWRSQPGTGLPRPLHPSRGAVEPATAGCERWRGHVSMERLSCQRAGKIACDDARKRRVHPALSHPCAATRLPAHPVLRRALKPQSKSAPGTMPSPADSAHTRSVAESRRLPSMASACDGRIGTMLSEVRQRQNGSHACPASIPDNRSGVVVAGFIMTTTFPSTIREGIAVSAMNGRALSKDTIYMGVTRIRRDTTPRPADRRLPAVHIHPKPPANWPADHSPLPLDIPQYKAKPITPATARFYKGEAV